MSEQETTLEEFADSDGEVSTTDDSRQELFGLGKLPAYWGVEKLSEIAEIIPGNSPPSSTYNEDREGLPFFQGNSEFGHFHPVADTWCSDPRKEAEEHDILMSIRAPVGDLNIADRNCCIGRGLAALRPKQLNGLYLFYNLAERQIWLSRLATGSTFKSVTKSDLQLLDVPVPPLEEQRKIASVLYNVDQAIQKTEEAIEQGEQTKKGVIQENIIDQITQSQSPTALGEVPENWDKVRLAEVANEEEDSLVDGPFGSSLKAEEFVEDGFARIIQLQNVKEGWYSDSNIRYVDEETYLDLERHSAKPGDLFIAKMASPVARACILPDEYEHYMLGCADVVKLIPSSEFIDKFVMYCLNSYPVWKQAAAHIRGSGRLRVNLNQLKGVEIPKPPIKEQKEIVSAVDGISEYIESHKDEKQRLQRLKQGLMQDLLSGEVRTTDTDIPVLDAVAQHG